MANIKITEGQYNRLFDKPKEIIISESQYNKMFSLITEDRESKNMKKARNVVKSMFPDMDAMQVITAYPTKTITWDDGSVEKVGNMNESISYNPTGSRTKPEVDMTVNTDRHDDNNLAPNNADTRMFGYKSMLNHTTDGSTTIKEKFLILNMVNKMYRKAINYAWYKGKRKIILPTDEECT